MNKEGEVENCHSGIVGGTKRENEGRLSERVLCLFSFAAR